VGKVVLKRIIPEAESSFPFRSCIIFFIFFIHSSICGSTIFFSFLLFIKRKRRWSARWNEIKKEDYVSGQEKRKRKKRSSVSSVGFEKEKNTPTVMTRSLLFFTLDQLNSLFYNLRKPTGSKKRKWKEIEERSTAHIPFLSLNCVRWMIVFISFFLFFHSSSVGPCLLFFFY